ncbi:MAG: VanZ family protein [Janthinobacterium lividum]
MPTWLNLSFVLKLAAWACIALLAILSLLPADEIVRTSFGGHVEHATAYAGATLLLRLGYPGQRVVSQVTALIAYAAGLEYLQHFSPGRTPAVGDWIFSSIGVLIGGSIGQWLVRSIQLKPSRWLRS